MNFFLRLILIGSSTIILGSFAWAVMELENVQDRTFWRMFVGFIIAFLTSIILVECPKLAEAAQKAGCGVWLHVWRYGYHTASKNVARKCKHCKTAQERQSNSWIRCYPDNVRPG